MLVALPLRMLVLLEQMLVLPGLLLLVLLEQALLLRMLVEQALLLRMLVQFRYRRLGDRLRHILAVLPLISVRRF